MNPSRRAAVGGRDTSPPIAFLGSPEIAVLTLRALVEAGWPVTLVVSRADARRGRGGTVSPSPVKAAARELGIEVAERADDVRARGIGLGVVVAFGELIRPAVLAEVPMVNLHFSLLPRWRGAAPVERAILAGDLTTGVCVMGVETGLDTGPVYASAEVEIRSEHTAATLRAELAQRGTALLLEVLAAGLAAPRPQSGEATYAAKITPADLRLHWCRPAVERHRQVRVGGAWTIWRGKRVKVLAADLVDASAVGGVLGAGAGDGVVGGLRLRRVQLEGKAATEWDEFVRGARLGPDDAFVDPVGDDDR